MSEMCEPRREVVVLGAGMTGVAAAERLRRAGRDVLLLDRIAPGAPGQTSYGNAGLIARAAIEPVSEPGLLWRAPLMLLNRNAPLFLRAAYFRSLLPWLKPFLRNTTPAAHRRLTDAIAPLVLGAIDEHLSLAEGTPAARFIRRGDYVYLYSSPRKLRAAAGHYRIRGDHGIDFRQLEEAELRARIPGLGLKAPAGVVYPDYAWLTDPGGYVAALAEHYLLSGGAFRRAEAADLRPDEGGVTIDLLGGGTLRAERVILAAGAWSGRFAQRFAPAPLETERGYHLMLKGASARPLHPVMVAEAAMVMTPMERGLRCAGLVEMGGLDAPPSAAPVELIRRTIKRILPDMTWEEEEVWMGHRPSFPDSLPMLGPAPGAARVIHAFGGQHVGLTMGPLLGRLAAGMACGETPNLDLSALSPARFTR